MKKLQLKSWVQTTLISWGVLDFMLVALALYMERILELSL